MEKRLYHSRRDKMIAGVCCGLGEYFKIDPVLIRLCIVILVFINAINVIAYILLRILVGLLLLLANFNLFFSSKVGRCVSIILKERIGTLGG